MTVSSSVNRSGPYLGNGVTRIFDYDFKITDQSQIRPVLSVAGVESDLVLGTDYSVAGVNNAGGGQVTLTAPLAAGDYLTLVLNIPFTQEIDLQNQGAYYADTVEGALDLAAMRDQQLKEQVDRAVTIPVSADPAAKDTLIASVLRMAASAEEIDSVAGIATSVVAVASHATDVVTVAGVAAGVTSVAGIHDAVAGVAAVSAAVSAVSADSANINAVAGDLGNINAVAGDLTNINAVAADLTAINAAPAAASAAAGSASAAAASAGTATGAATSAQGAATNAQGYASNAASSAAAAAASAGAVTPATAAEINAGTSVHVVPVNQAWAAALVTALGNVSGTIALDFATASSFDTTLTGNSTLGNPTNAKQGQSGFILIRQDATGNRTLAFGTSWKFAGGLTPSLNTAASSLHVLFYQVITSTYIVASLWKPN